MKNKPGKTGTIDTIKAIQDLGIFESMENAIGVHSADYRILYQNRIHRELFKSRTGQSCYEVYDSGSGVCNDCPLTLTLQDGAVHTVEKVIQIGRERRYFEITTSPLKDSSGEINAIVYYLVDITERKRSETILQESENRYRSLVESTDDSIYLVDKNYRYLFMNKKHLLRLGLLGTQFMERAYGDFHTSKETRSFMEKIDRIFETGRSTQYEYRSPRDDKYFLQTFSPVKDSTGAVTAVTVISTDITALKVLEEKLRILSFTDELTGLYNRRGFFALAEQQLKLANREKTGKLLLSIDLDYLKKINDTYGHSEGDLILMETALLLKKSFRESDITARIGGDEFAVLVTENAEIKLEDITSRLNANLESRNTETNKPYMLSLSVGLTRYDPEQPCSIDELISNADKRMYEEKKKRQHPS